MVTGSGQRGQVLVEFSLAILFVLTLLLAIAEFGRALFTYDLVQNAARVGTRYAMARGSGCVSYAASPSPVPGPPCTAYASSPPVAPSPYVTPITAYVQAKQTGINTSLLTVTTTWSTDCTFSAPTTTPTGSGSCVKVNVSYPFHSIFPFTFPLNMTATSQIVVTQ